MTVEKAQVSTARHASLRLTVEKKAQVLTVDKAQVSRARHANLRLTVEKKGQVPSARPASRRPYVNVMPS